MKKNTLKTGIRTIEKRGIHYVLDDTNKNKSIKPWLGDCLSFMYDRVMKNSIFPKKFGGDIKHHFDILRRELKDIHGKHVFELATGSGNTAFFLNSDNDYTGTDISPGLLRKAANRFVASGFKNARFYVVPAEALPFESDSFDVGLCHLSLNFFIDIRSSIRELRRVLVPGAFLFCSVPVPERNYLNATIRGTLLTEEELRSRFEAQGFSFSPLPDENGALLYFTAILDNAKV
jgi:SAM-dependent methyltransferase